MYSKLALITCLGLPIAGPPLLILIYLFIVCGGQRTICGNKFFPSTMKVPGLKLGFQVGDKRPYPLRHLVVLLR